MSRKERVVAALLLAIAVAGGALIPRLLASPTNPLGIALGPGPSRSVVQAPAITKRPHRATPSQQTSSTPAAIVTPGAPVVPVPAAQPTPAPPAKHAPASAPPPVTTPRPTPTPTPVPVPTSPAVIHLPAAVGHGGTAPGQLKTPPGHEKIPPGQLKKEGKDQGEQRNEAADLEGSGHGRPVQQAPSHAVGTHRGRVGHLAPPSPRPAPPADAGRSQARPEARSSRGEGRLGSPPQVAG